MNASYTPPFLLLPVHKAKKICASLTHKKELFNE